MNIVRGAEKLPAPSGTGVCRICFRSVTVSVKDSEGEAEVCRNVTNTGAAKDIRRGRGVEISMKCGRGDTYGSWERMR